MGRFPWQQGHSKQGSDKQQIIPHDWFNKSTAEPSRQALNEMMKDHASISSSGTQPARTRSRTNTISSSNSQGAKSSSDPSVEATARPPSGQNVVEDLPVMTGRQEKVSRSLLSKGSRIIRRQTSKLSLLQSQLEDSTKDNEGSSVGLSRTKSTHSPRRDIRAQISGPFGFQHVTHTDQSQYQSLNIASKIEMITGFSALQAVSLPADELKGIPVSDLPSPAEEPEEHRASQPSSPKSPAFSIVPSLPNTPPKPEPPPKDSHSQPTSAEVRSSRILGNFSRPTRISALIAEPPAPLEALPEPMRSSVLQSSTAPSSPTRLGIVLESESDQSFPKAYSTSTSPVSPELLDKPLPQPPTIVHAVSTNDDSALLLRTAPLPQVPLAGSAGPSSLRESTSTTGSKARGSSTLPLRHMQSCPLDRVTRRRSQSSESPIANCMEGLILASPNRPVQSERPISVGLKPIDIDDWENAIDYSWDAMDTDDGQRNSRASPTGHNIGFLPPTRFSASEPYQAPPVASAQVDTANDNNVHEAVSLVNSRPRQAPDAIEHSSLQGLGIERACGINTAGSNAEADTGLEKDRVSLRVPHLRREPGSPMSKSSSQESIILSIASSIHGTYRSSNSSTSLGDLSQLVCIEDEDTLPQDCRPVLSGGNTSDASQETVVTDRKSTGSSKTRLSSPTAEDEDCDDTLEALPAIRHERGASAARLPSVPNRTSSIAAPPSGTGSVTRQRASTLTGKPKASRSSYSLFPTTHTLPANSNYLGGL